MNLKEILLELSNYIGILENLDKYLISIAPIGNWESMLKDYNARKASADYVDSIKERISKLKEQMSNMNDNNIEANKAFDYITELIERYQKINQTKIDELVEKISNSLVSNDLKIELVSRKEDWNLILENEVIDSIYTCESGNDESAFFISFAKSHSTENLFMNSANESFDFFCSAVLSHVDKNTVYLSKNNVANSKEDLERYLENIKIAHQNPENRHEVIFTDEEIEKLDDLCQMIVESDTEILKFEKEVSSFFENLGEPIKISNAIIYIENKLNKASNINPFGLNKIKAMNIASLSLLLVANLSKSNAPQAIATINLIFGTIMSAIDTLHIANSKKQEIKKYKDNLQLLKVSLFNDLKLTEIVNGKKAKNVIVKLSSGQTIPIDQYDDIKKSLSLQKNNNFEMAKGASLPSMKKATNIAIFVTTLSLVVTMAIAPLAVIIKDSIENQIEISRQAKIPVEIDYSSMSEKEYAEHQNFEVIKENIDDLMALEQKVGDYYLLYEYAYEVEVPVEVSYFQEVDGKQVEKKKTEYEKETRFDFAENPNHPGCTGMMQIKYTCFNGFTLTLTKQGWVQNHIESFNINEFISSAKYFIPEKVLDKNVTPMFTEDEFDDYFDSEKFTNNVGYDIPKHILGNSKVLG
jgi:hypothetical protein